MNQYSKFVQVYEANKGSSDRMGDTIKYCVEHDILKEYIERKGKEVLSMLTMDWDYEETMEVAREESKEKRKRICYKILSGRGFNTAFGKSHGQDCFGNPTDII
ncbi:MAG: hypothetical protein K2K74_16905 [Lachnospiraceae bacterium]|nr:hypothetical protein [Lachnospiraceae bacterium]